MEERLTMTEREIDRLRVIHQVLEGRLKWREAAKQLGLCKRQIGYLCARVCTEGNRGIIHRLRGRASNHRLVPGVLEKAIVLVKQYYPDFGPTFANEKLRSRHRLVISTSSLRVGLIAAGVWRQKRRKVKHRAWRVRRSCVGEMVQLDGSDHEWFEARGPRCVLLIYIDDATSRILYGEFVGVEDTQTLMRTTKRYIERYGRPVSFYVDKDSIYKINRQATIEEQLRDEQALTQFTRAMKELRIEVIWANSPQAKGRVERGFLTHQDRLVKELRLAKISTIREANRFLWGNYIPGHNERFAVEPENETDAHRRVLETQRLEQILSIQTQRSVGNDFTLRVQNLWYQLLKDQPVRIRPKNRVMVEMWLDGSMHLRARGKELVFKLIRKQAVDPVVVLPKTRLRSGMGWVTRPPADHPWKTRPYKTMLKREAAELNGTKKPCNF